MKKLIRNKKANLEDILWVTVVFFALIVCFFVVYFVWNKINPEFNNAMAGAMTSNDTTNVTWVGDQTKGALGLFDDLFPMIMVGYIIFLVISSFFIQSHPVFFFVSLIVGAVVALVSIILSNFFGEFIANPEFATEAADFNVTSFIMSHYLIFILIIAFVVFIILFTKPASQGDGL